MNALFSELSKIKNDVEKWRSDLPSFYEPIVVPVSNTDGMLNPAALTNYPYTERLDYLTGKT